MNNCQYSFEGLMSAGPIRWEPVCIHPMTCFPIIPTTKPKTAPSGGIQCRRILDFGGNVLKDDIQNASCGEAHDASGQLRMVL
jgi:hypothetical protein